MILDQCKRFIDEKLEEKDIRSQTQENFTKISEQFITWLKDSGVMESLNGKRDGESILSVWLRAMRNDGDDGQVSAEDLMRT